MKFINFFGIKLANVKVNTILEYAIKKNIRIINCLNPHSYINVLSDKLFYSVFKFKKSLNIIDGFGIQLYFFLSRLKFVQRVVGYDVLIYSLNNLNSKKIFFLGSSNLVLKLIKNRIKNEFPKIEVEYYSPPYKEYFSDNTNNLIIKKINKFKPDVLYVGLGAPKQEKWSLKNLKFLNTKLILNIGGAIDYYAKYSRPHYIFRKIELEWLVTLTREPIRVLDRTFISGVIFILFLIKSAFIKNYKYFNYLNLDIYDDIKKINLKLKNNNKFILSAFNLQFFIEILLNNKFYTVNTLLWSDGIFSKIFNPKIKKVPGSSILRNIKLKKNINRIIVLGNYNLKDKNFLKKKFKNHYIKHYSLPYASTKIIIKKLPKLNDLNKTLILITLPTPKQEYVAKFIIKKYQNTKIICIGGGLSIASGHEKECPNFLRMIGFEWIWRLQYEPLRRLNRIIICILYLLYFILIGKFLKNKIKRVT
jgi:N-acetylglucosaminyldiphosphoundecaprenol N-acetyl-beta-D-mannosaminyltransferase